MILYSQSVGFETLPVTRFTLESEVGHKLHLYRYCAFALALFASSTFTVKTEITRQIAHLLTEWLVCPQLANLVVCLEVGHRVTAGTLANRVLVHKLDVTKIM